MVLTGPLSLIKNDMAFNLKFITDTLNCDVAGNGDRTTEITDVLFDSRSLIEPEGTIFCAIRTKSADGHNYIRELYAKGVRLFMVENLPPGIEKMDDALFVVVGRDKVVPSIEKLAMERRKKLKNVIGVTGSTGKTVVKEMIFKALALGDNGGGVSRSPRSWNSRLGVPMTLLESSLTDKAVIVEAGIDTVGDMAAHAEIVRPETGVLTSITDEHNAGFESREQKIREKIKFFKYSERIFYDASSADVGEILKETYPDKTLIPIKGNDINETNIKIASEVSKNCIIEENIAINRIDVHQGVNDCVMLFDDFTNDLRSLRWSLDFMRRRSDGRKSTLIMSDLFHGQMDEDELKILYSSLGKLLRNFSINRLIAIGPELKRFKNEIPEEIDVENVDSTVEFLAEYDITRFSSETILISGSPKHDFHEIRNSLESPRHDTILEINLDAIVHNFNYYRSLLKPNTGTVAMVKAEAYGVGAAEVAKTLQTQGANYLAVAVIDEGIELRRRGITMPIMVLNPVTTNYRALFRYRLEPSVFSPKELEILAYEAEKAGEKDFPAHIKLDTGMHRVGFTINEIATLTDRLKSITSLKVASIFSHLATADCPEEAEYTQKQLETFEEASQRIMSSLPYRPLRHILNTAGIMTHPESQYDMVRIGIGLYGISPLEKIGKDLRPVATLKSTIISIKRWPKGTTIGYGRKGLLERDSIIATLPIGYADGLDRHLSRGAAKFLVKGVDCPTVGNICMDQCMIDVTDVPQVSIGDSVEIFGEHRPIEQVADTLGTISYEVLTSVSPRVRRIYFRD